RRQRRSRGEVVAGQHRDVVAAAAQPGNDLPGFWPQLVTNGDRADESPIVFNEDDAGPRLLHSLELGVQRSRFEPARTAQSDEPPIEPTAESGAGYSLDVDRRLRPQRFRLGKDRPRERVLTARFERRSNRQYMLARSTVRGDDLHDDRPIAGERAGLVEANASHATERFEGG